MRQSSLKMGVSGGNLPMLEIKLWSLKENKYRRSYLTLDTGASITTLPKNILNILGYTFQHKKNQRIITASGVELVESINLEKMKIGVFELEDVEVYALNFPEESFIAGVLGINVLSKFDIELNFSKKEVVFKEIID